MKSVSIYKHVLLLVILLFGGKISIAQQWSLQKCIDSAQVHNKNLQIAKGNITINEIKQKEAKSNLWPKLTANAEYKYFTNLPYQLMPLSTFNPMAKEGEFKEAQFGVPHNINGNLQLAIPLYNTQLYGGIQASKIASELTTLQYEKSKEQIYFEIAGLYYNTQILQTQLLFLDSNLSNSNKLLKNIILLHENLLATNIDVEKIELQVAQLQTQKSNIQSKIIQLLNALKFAIGLPNEAEFMIEKTIKSISVTEYNIKPSLDTRISNTQNKLLLNDLKTLTHTRYLPSINIVGSYGTTGFGYDKNPNQFIKFFPIGFAGLQISYSIFNGTTTLKKINQKHIELKNNELKTALNEEQNSMQIANTLMQRNTNFFAIETTLQQINLAQKIYNNIILQNKLGVASLTEILLSDIALREAQQNNLNAMIEYLKADLELKKLTANL